MRNLPDNLDYWGLDHEERAALTEEEVQRYIDLELMREGVVKPQPPTLQDEVPPKVPTTTFYRPRIGTYDPLSVAFETPEQAADFLNLNPFKVASEWECGHDVQYGKPVRAEMSVEEVHLATEQDFVNHKEALRKANAAKSANEKARAQFNEAMSDANKVAEGVWDKWHESRAEVRARESLREKWSDYLKLCKGDESIAFPFLRKAYTDEQIKAALGQDRFDDLSRPAIVEAEASE